MIGIDTYAKLILGARTKPYEAALRPCNEIINAMDMEIFNTKVYPVLNRSLLRNPEIIIEGNFVVLIRWISMEDFSSCTFITQ